MRPNDYIYDESYFVRKCFFFQKTTLLLNSISDAQGRILIKIKTSVDAIKSSNIYLHSYVALKSALIVFQSDLNLSQAGMFSLMLFLRWAAYFNTTQLL